MRAIDVLCVCVFLMGVFMCASSGQGTSGMLRFCVLLKVPSPVRAKERLQN